MKILKILYTILSARAGTALLARVSLLCAAVLFAALSLLSSCGTDPVVPGGGGGNGGGGGGDKPADLTGANKWIYDKLCEWYYWNDAVKAARVPSNSLSYDRFFESLLMGLDDARDITENPPTVDGGFYDGNPANTNSSNRYIYSTIERLSTGASRAGSVASRASAAAQDGFQTTFGFDVEPVQIGTSGSRVQVGLLVMWVLPGGPADEAGLERGMLLTEYDGAYIYTSNTDGLEWEDFWYRLHYQVGGLSMALADESGRDFSLTAASMKVSPVMFHDVITVGAYASEKKVAYLLYNAFEAGAAVDAGGGEFDYELRRVFADFKARGATELVLDLRYNPGGDVSSCRILTSLVGNVGPSLTFAKMLFNSDLAAANRWANPEVMRFTDEADGLKLDKIYVLATNRSASASEMVISSLRGALGNDAVVHIGTRTEGKNVGMNQVKATVDGAQYEMWPITFKILNAVNFCDYAGGFTPDYAKDEFWDVFHADGSGVIHPLGDSNERLLDAALTLIRGGRVVSDPATRASASATTRATALPETIKKLRDPRRGGARMYEFPEPENRNPQEPETGRTRNPEEPATPTS